ncbi:MAG: ABC transporter ATP-binding protein, partial [Methylococcales bacterium]|nr:ABC transporter ATP-binding protein [Methylococcales bacterium]
MPSKPSIQVNQLCLNYGHFEAVKNINFNLKCGEIIGFLGVNGAGKSTTIKMLTGNLAPTQGDVIISGFSLSDDSIRAKNCLGYLPENPPLYNAMRVDDYLLFCAKIHHVKKQQLKESLDNVKQRCGITSVGQKIIGQLSKGYQQRIGIAQAIIHQPAFIILDEPTVALDPVQIIEVRQLIKKLSQHHGVIFSTHILSEVTELCDRVIVIDHGKIIYQDSIDELKTRLQTSSLSLAFTTPPNIDTLLKIAPITQATQIDNQHFKVDFDKTINP